MKTVSLIGVASYLPARVVTNDFFAPGAAARKGMFTAPTTRRHVGPDESAADMIERAAARLIREQNIDVARDIDVLFTNVAVPDQAFTGCGAEVAHRIGARPRWVVDLHNSGCVAFIDSSHFSPQLGTLTFEKMIKGMMGMGAPDQSKIQDALTGFRRFAGVLDKRLDGKKYVVGNALTLADLTLASSLMYAEATETPLGEFPHVKEWFSTITALDAWTKSAT